MSCYHPLVGIWRGDYTESGKKKYKIEGHLDPNDCPTVYEKIVIPCGKCIGCRLDYSRYWADRMMLELETSKKAIFVTLTYNNDNLPVCQYDENGDPLYGTLCKRDCQLWLKRLRKKFEGVKVRFYLAGEYGETTLRPHYHAIVFGIGLSDLDDLCEHGTNEVGDRYYISPTLSQTWSLGFVLVADVSWRTCAYVARYVTKKWTGAWSIDYAIRNCIPEFSLMSRKPGIGAEYLDSHPDCLDLQNINISTPEGGLKIHIPKYYLKKLNYLPVKDGKERIDLNPLYNPEKYDKMRKERKEFAEDNMLLKLQKTGIGYLDYLSNIEEQNKIDSVKILKRNKA